MSHHHPKDKDNNRTLRGQLQSISSKIKTNPMRAPAASAMNWVGDGVDHINIWEKANTELGRFLAHGSNNDFNHSQLGRFNNMEALWHYVQSAERDDRIRNMRGRYLKNFSKQLTPMRVSNFKAIIMDSNYQRIQQYRPMVELMIATDLPFDCYYINNDSKLRIRPVFFKWLILGFEEIRHAIKENRAPNFTEFMDNPAIGIYDSVLQAVGTKEKKSPIPPSKPTVTGPVLTDAESSELLRNLESVMGVKSPVAAIAIEPTNRRELDLGLKQVLPAV